MKNLAGMLKPELLEIATDLQINGRHRMTVPELRENIIGKAPNDYQYDLVDTHVGADSPYSAPSGGGYGGGYSGGYNSMSAGRTARKAAQSKIAGTHGLSTQAKLDRINGAIADLETAKEYYEGVLAG